MDSTYSWDTYARLQKQLSDANTVNDRTWGLEAGLEELLQPPASAGTDIERVVRSRGRKTRNQARLRRLHADGLTAYAIDGSLLARHYLRVAERVVRRDDWNVLCALADGEDYREVARPLGISEGCLRGRVLRVRRAALSEIDYEPRASY